jgi:hypothetical protein
MMIERSIAHAPRTAALAQDVSRMTTTCIGCTDCGGLCQAMIEVVVVPQIVLHHRDPR